MDRTDYTILIIFAFIMALGGMNIDLLIAGASQ